MTQLDELRKRERGEGWRRVKGENGKEGRREREDKERRKGDKERKVITVAEALIKDCLF